jgi:hypothetical protein
MNLHLKKLQILLKMILYGKALEKSSPSEADKKES